MPIVSVIVPIYRVEKYLRQCIDSIVSQSYMELEIILVDDGSPDNCGQICDEYAKKDSRIKVIRQANGGLSAARNAGLEIATGDYISFIDSDDYIDENLYKDIMNIFCKQNVDIVKFTSRRVIGDKIITYPHTCGINVMCARDALLDFLNHEGACAWNKVYKREVIGDIRFPVGRVFEDTAVVYKFIANSKQYAVYDKPYYFYRYNDSSITQTSFSPKARWDFVLANEETYEYCKEHVPECVDVRRGVLVKSLLSCLTAVYASNDIATRDKYYNMVSEKIEKYRDSTCYKYMNGKYQLYLWCFGRFDFVHKVGAKLSLWSKKLKRFIK